MINLRNGTQLFIIIKTKFDGDDFLLYDKNNNNLPKCFFEQDLPTSLNNYFQKTFGMKYCNEGDTLDLYEEESNKIYVINKNFNYQLFTRIILYSTSIFKFHKLNNYSKNKIFQNIYSLNHDFYKFNFKMNETENINEPIDIDSKNIINVVAGILIDKNNNILIQRRKNGLWEFPGGKQEINEYLIDALCREFKEELNIDLYKNNCTLLQSFYKNLNDKDYIFHLFSIGNQEINLNQIQVNEAIEYQIVNFNDLDKYEFMSVDNENFIPYLKNIVHILNRVEFTNNNNNNNNMKGNVIMNTNEMPNSVMSEMNNTFNTNMFNKLDTGVCKYTMSGTIAVKTSTGYKSYDVKTNKFTNCNNFCLPFGDGMFFVMPATKVNPGDIIILNNAPVCVIKYENNECTVINYETGKVETIIPERNFMFGNFYFFHKIVSMFGKMFSGGFKGFGGNMIKYMMMSQMFNKNNNCQNNMFGGIDMNTLMMMQMMKKNNSDSDNCFDFLDGMFDFDETDDEDTSKTTVSEN